MKTLAVFIACFALQGCSRTQPNINFCIVDCQYREDDKTEEAPKPKTEYIIIEQPRYVRKVP